jgi:hypothetical protein
MGKAVHVRGRVRFSLLLGFQLNVALNKALLKARTMATSRKSESFPWDFTRTSRQDFRISGCVRIYYLKKGP